MSYTFKPTKVSVCFYDRSDDWRGKVIKYLTRSDIHHCGILLERDDKSIILASDKSHKAKFVDSKRFHGYAYQPTHVFDFEEVPVSIQQLTDFLYSHDKQAWREKSSKLETRRINYDYMGDGRSLVFWFFLGRFILPRLLPPSCALITCYLLRMCGIKVNTHVEPRTLYKELDDAVDFNCWTGWRREDHLSKDYC